MPRWFSTNSICVRIDEPECGLSNGSRRVQVVIVVVGRDALRAAKEFAVSATRPKCIDGSEL